MKSPTWLKDAIFYEIYPQSFYDTNGDGIGDLNGIKEKLDYIKSIGCNAIWINPCFDSPFKDAGYDVRDYKKIASRYGTNEDMFELVKVAHEKGIKILLDLVPCHTSDQYPWFLDSKISAKAQYSSRYVWTNDAFTKGRGATFVGGEAPRSGTYAISYFHSQPSLNYGYLNPIHPWEKPIDHPDCLATREAMKDVIRYWLSNGVDGFRVDMAACLVREDFEEQGTMTVWKDIFSDIPNNIFAVFLPVNGCGNNMNMEDAESFCQVINPKFAVPIHCGMFDNIDLNKFKYNNKIIPKIYEEVKFI